MPMANRQQGLHYDELVQGLAGKKRWVRVLGVPAYSRTFFFCCQSCEIREIYTTKGLKVDAKLLQNRIIRAPYMLLAPTVHIGEKTRRQAIF